MCLAVPGKIIEISRKSPLDCTGKVNFSGVIKEVSLALVPESTIGDYVIVHAGVALNIVDEQEALSLLKMVEELDQAKGGSL